MVERSLINDIEIFYLFLFSNSKKKKKKLAIFGKNLPLKEWEGEGGGVNQYVEIGLRTCGRL
jgi:hypothetical protein